MLKRILPIAIAINLMVIEGVAFSNNGIFAACSPTTKCQGIRYAQKVCGTNETYEELYLVTCDSDTRLRENYLVPNFKVKGWYGFLVGVNRTFKTPSAAISNLCNPKNDWPQTPSPHFKEC
ncbi:hypothetical protein [Coxiella burnetii]|uniref:hypothetical protein n=1 Tax=Coxiella burnetii TaxID=777 RepID=UPI000183D074|nr:hypothetical protein [Coxiella burnetii]ACJ17668.1 hypothetical protein CbuG_0224 [Coxiella burnetii CbuG_Q212]ATN66122.1 hypothetical protein AYM17_01050 [Coxiella burnetii]OYK86948.1 hypothetical protein CbuQ229_01125 [Coxiella burnetii]